MLAISKLLAHIPDLKHQRELQKEIHSHKPHLIVHEEHNGFHFDVDKIFEFVEFQATRHGMAGFAAILEIVKEYEQEDSDNLDITEHLLHEILELELDEEQMEHLKQVDHKIDTAIHILNAFPEVEEKIDEKISHWTHGKLDLMELDELIKNVIEY